MDPESVVVQYLRALLPTRPQRRPQDVPLMSAAAFLMAHGRIWAEGARPRNIQPGAAQACYQNAFRLATHHPREYRYAEGIALVPKFNVPVEHAWCVTDEGTVVDPTWDDAESAFYFGVAFDMVTLSKVYSVIETGGVFWYENWRVAAPVLLSGTHLNSSAEPDL